MIQSQQINQILQEYSKKLQSLKQQKKKIVEEALVIIDEQQVQQIRKEIQSLP